MSGESWPDPSLSFQPALLPQDQSCSIAPSIHFCPTNFTFFTSPSLTSRVLHLRPAVVNALCGGRPSDPHREQRPPSMAAVLPITCVLRSFLQRPPFSFAPRRISPFPSLQQNTVYQRIPEEKTTIQPHVVARFCVHVHVLWRGLPCCGSVLWRGLLIAPLLRPKSPLSGIPFPVLPPTTTPCRAGF